MSDLINLGAALQYAGRDWAVLPMHGKRFLTRDGVRIATRDRNIIERWRWPGIGMACGAPSNVDVLDIDNPEQSPLEVAAFMATTLAATTPSGGCHLFFKHAGLCSRTFAWGEWRSTGLAVVLPPAPGRTWAGNLPIAEAPPELIELIQRPRTRAPAFGSFPPGPLMATGELPKPLYLKVLRLVPLSSRVTRHHQRRVIGILKIALARTEYRNDGLNIAGFCLRELIRDGIIDCAGAEELLTDVAVLNGYIAKHGSEPAIATIRSGLGVKP